ncbi:MAG: DUF4959 domain-containing protein, partial [Dysgonamonadaceae bacterium]|nr:DUF4959 domain-containing protein [Dysgonamonadaceae bacterium]
MKKIKDKWQWLVNYCVSALLLMVIPACSGELEHGPIGTGNTSAPAPVRNVMVENISGGAILTYELPDNTDLLYVKAVYDLNGVRRERRVSAYVNQLKVEGFGDTGAHTVELYAVNRMEVASAPVKQIIQPLTPSILLVRETLRADADFGGFTVSFENHGKADIAIYAIKKDTIEEKFTEHDALYTAIEKGTFRVRNLPPKSNDFGVYVVDRWNNFSDTLFFTLTPWKEELLDKKLFRHKTVQGDVSWNNYSVGRPESAYDGVVANNNYAHTQYPLDFPHRYTLDLGVPVRLSRFLFYQRPGDDVLYQHGAPKVYNLYGRTDDPGNGSSDVLDGWTLLMTCKSFKPSGLPLGQNSSEDVEFAANG